MATSGLKAPITRVSRSWNLPDKAEKADKADKADKDQRGACGTALLERETEFPPRLCRRDLKDPEGFHRRLVEWLMKQR